MIINDIPREEYLLTMRNRDFYQPICFDPENVFIRNNPQLNTKYNSFLLDSNDSIIAVGNPAENPKIREFYKKILMLDSCMENEGVVLCENNSRAIGCAYNGETYKEKFLLKNITDSLLTIKTLVSSSDNTIVNINTDSIFPHDETRVTVYYHPEDNNLGSFINCIEVWFNEKKDPEKLYIHGFLVQ